MAQRLEDPDKENHAQLLVRHSHGMITDPGESEAQEGRVAIDKVFAQYKETRGRRLRCHGNTGSLAQATLVLSSRIGDGPSHGPELHRGKSNLSRYSPAQNVICRLGMYADHGREGAPARPLPHPLLSW